jgi:signal transduction histidine kinase
VTSPSPRRTASVSPGIGRAVPLAELLEALETVLRDLDHAGDGRIEAALDSLLTIAGARGAYLEIAAPPLRGLAVGAGSLTNQQDVEKRADITRSELRATADSTPLGTLWLDGPGVTGETTARLISLTLDAAWSKAMVAQTTERVAALDAATRGIAGLLDVDGVLELIVERVRDLVRARYAALGIVDQTGVIERFVTAGINADDRERIGELPRGHGLLGLIIREGRAFRIPEIAAHPDSSGFPPQHPPMHSFLGVPVTVKGVSVGNLYLTDKVGAVEFSEADEALVESFARHAGIAIENARLHAQVQRLAVVEERERIAKDLHDGVIQNIYAVGLALEDLPELIDTDRAEMLARIDRAIDALHVTIRDIRNFILGLRPELLDQRDLVGSLVALAQEIRLNSLIEIDTAIDPAAAAALPESTRAPFFHIAREALSNTARHSHATRAVIALRVDGGTVTLEIGDNGVGFAPDQERPSTHQGLANMTERAARHGGRLTIESSVGAGTRIIVTVDGTNDPTDGSGAANATEQEGR